MCGCVGVCVCVCLCVCVVYVPAGARKSTHLCGQGSRVVTSSIHGIIVGRVSLHCFMFRGADACDIPLRLHIGFEELALFLVAGFPSD